MDARIQVQAKDVVLGDMFTTWSHGDMREAVSIASSLTYRGSILILTREGYSLVRPEAPMWVERQA